MSDPTSNPLGRDLPSSSVNVNSLAGFGGLAQNMWPLGLPTATLLDQSLEGWRGNTLLGGLAPAALGRYRSRSDWNDRFEHWERPASTTEESSLDRGRRMVKAAIKDAVWLNTQMASVEPQGSYHNNTNTRIDSDVDLRVQLPLIKVFYHPNVAVPYARSVLGLSDSSWSYQQIFSIVRRELEACLCKAFGKENVIPGKKAFRIKGITGSRAEVDVVPAIRYQNIMWWGFENRYNTIEGVAILSTDGNWTHNYPDHHRASGLTKRARTGHQFKKVVRIFKRLRADLAERGLLLTKVPSFLVESLIYNVEDWHFNVPGDDRYDRVRRVARRLQSMLSHGPTATCALEVNGIKPLFTTDQAWTLADAITFANAVVTHIGDA